MKTKSTFWLTILCVAGFNSVAQDTFKCGSQQKMSAVFETYPELLEDNQRLIENSKTYRTNDRGDREEVYIIPVVFHIIHEYGDENISDDQVYDQMEILNIDYRLLNPDTVEIMNEFKSIATDAQIEFRLATIDPFGNCTNGIEHINSHETNKGDDASKLNQWPRSRYLNVWVVKSMENGVAGYAYYPSAVSGGLYYADGIIIRHNYIGSIGTSDAFSSRALTHEIGHYLGLPHTWGNTNDPEVACGDDGIQDTPLTAGHLTCPLVNTDNCIPDSAENVQNYMEYSYCSRMFTSDQVDVMRLSLVDPVSSRDNLSTSANHSVTGVDITAPQCTPLSDFYIEKPLICAGQSVTYHATPSRAVVTSFNWHFPGGTPEYSTSPTPTVTYAAAGIYEAELTVGNSTGSDTKTVQHVIEVAGDWWEYLGPYSESFESGSFEPHWISINTEDDESAFEVHENVGYTGNHAVGVIYFKDNLDPILDINYWQRIGGSKEILITPVYNLSNTSSPMLTFKYSHATSTSGLFEPDDLNLRVYYSVNCGASWSVLQNIQDMDVLTAGYQGNNFMPTDQSLWSTVYVSLPAGALQEQVRFKFEFVAADYSNNFFLDDINVTGVLLTEENTVEINDVSVFPNPVSDVAQGVQVNYSLHREEQVQFNIHDILGNLVMTTSASGVQGTNKEEISFDGYQFSAGIYTLSVVTSTGTQSVKLIVQ